MNEKYSFGIRMAHQTNIAIILFGVHDLEIIFFLDFKRIG